MSDELANIICQDSGSEIVLLEALVSITLAHNLTSYEQNLYGNFLQAVGQNLCIMSIKKAKCISELKEETQSTNDYTNYKKNSINPQISNEITREKGCII